MRIPFRQGIITYPVSGNLQNFLISSGIYVSLYAANGRTDVAFAHGSEDYLLTESETVQDAWGPLPGSTDCWLYWDIDKRTAVRTFGFTTVSPVYGEGQPPAINNQHWFDTVDQVMYVHTNGAYREVIRVFAAKFNNSVFTPIRFGTTTRPHSGSQVGLNSSPVWAGKILIDDLGNPVRRSTGHFFTTEHDFFVDGSPVNILRLESVVLTGTAQLEPLHAYQVVKFSEFGEINHAQYNDSQEAVVAILLEDLNRYDTGSVSLQGHVTNPYWNWTTVGASLWIDDTGSLIQYDPHVASPLIYPTGKSPVARVITQHSIMFDQGLGGKGDAGPAGAVVGLASDGNFGVVRLSVPATNPETPIVVGDNDPRMTNARTPLAHTHVATAVIPTPYGSLTGANLQLMLQQLEDNKLPKSGGTLTGSLTLSGAPADANHAASKAYVDAIDLSSRVAKAGDTMTGLLVLSANATSPLHAVPKQQLDSAIAGVDLTSRVAKAGDTMTGLLVLSANATSPLHAVPKQQLDSAIAGVDLTSRVAKAGDTMTGYLTLSGSPADANHAASKAYVDAFAQGLIVKLAVKVATTTDLGALYNNGTAGVGGTLTIPPTLILNIDGNTTWALDDGVLVKNQTNALTNGRYMLSQLGSNTLEWILTRCSYYDESIEVPSSYMFVQHGATQSGTGWVALVEKGLGVNPNVFEVGFDNIRYTQFSGEGTYTAGYGLQLVGNQFSVTTINIPYDVAFYVPDNPFNPSARLSGFLVPRGVFVNTLVPNVGLAMCGVAPTSATGSTFGVYVNNTLMCSVTFPQNATVGTFTWTLPTFSLIRGDVINVRTTTSVDLNIAGIGITITGCANAPPCSLVIT